MESSNSHGYDRLSYEEAHNERVRLGEICRQHRLDNLSQQRVAAVTVVASSLLLAIGLGMSFMLIIIIGATTMVAGLFLHHRFKTDYNDFIQAYEIEEHVLKESSAP